MTDRNEESRRVSAAELEAIVASYRHLQGVHRDAQADSSHRRRLEGELSELERELTRLLLESDASDDDRRLWLECLLHGGEPPAAPGPARAPLVFAGVSGSGTRVEVRHREDGGYDYDVLLDGGLAERLPARHGEASLRTDGTFLHGGVEFRETFAVSDRARAALRAFVESPSEILPWAVSAELIADGLVDRNLSLTARGRRALRE